MRVSLVLGLVLLVAYIGWAVWKYLRLKQSATFLGNSEFATLMHSGQLIDIRDSESFRRRHILGARHFPITTLQTSLSALRKDKPVLIYDGSRNANLPRALAILKKAGYTQLYVLKNGFDYWDGKVK